jgi:hypothetical protein
MDAGLTTRPNDGAAHTAVVWPNPAPVSHAVATDLKPSQAVTAATNVAPARNDSRPVATPEPATRVDISFDKRTHMAIYRVVDTQTGRVIIQLPNKSHTDIAV